MLKRTGNSSIDRIVNAKADAVHMGLQQQEEDQEEQQQQQQQQWRQQKEQLLQVSSPPGPHTSDAQTASDIDPAHGALSWSSSLADCAGTAREAGHAPGAAQVCAGTEAAGAALACRPFLLGPNCQASAHDAEAHFWPGSVQISHMCQALCTACSLGLAPLDATALCLCGCPYVPSTPCTAAMA